MTDFDTIEVNINIENLFDDNFVGVPQVKYVVDLSEFNLSIEDVSDKTKYIVINEFRPESYRVYVNENFDVAGGRLVNKDFPENLLGARKLAAKLQERINADIVEHHLPAVTAPNWKYREITEETPEIPEFDEKLTEKSKFFKYYLAARVKRINITQLGMMIAEKLGRKYTPSFARQFYRHVERLNNAVKANVKMQEVLMKFHNKPTLPDLGAVIIPVYHRSLKTPRRDYAETRYGIIRHNEVVGNPEVVLNNQEKFVRNAIVEAFMFWDAEVEENANFEDNWKIEQISVGGEKIEVPVFQRADKIEEKKLTGPRNVEMSTLKDYTMFTFDGIVGWTIEKDDDMTLILSRGEFRRVSNKLIVTVE